MQNIPNSQEVQKINVVVKELAAIYGIKFSEVEGNPHSTFIDEKGVEHPLTPDDFFKVFGLHPPQLELK